MPASLYFFLAVWLLVVPPASALIAHDIIDEEIFTWLTAWVDRRFRGTRLAYLFRCPACLSHWIVMGWSLPFWSCWGLLPLDGLSRWATTAVLILAAIRITTRFWIS